MPKIECQDERLWNYIGRKFTLDGLKEILPAAKAELDGLGEEGELKLEFNDTNRPDLWSAAGLGRQLKTYLSGKLPEYDFFSRAASPRPCGSRLVKVDPKLENIRPYIVAFEITGKKVDDALLKEIIQSQEKLCWNYGRKRSSIAMGIYRSDMIEYPVLYRAADPDKDGFVPLGFEKRMSLREILKEHPKGQEFGHIIAHMPLYPYLTDSRGDVLSMPPVINSAHIGAVKEGDDTLFVELTGSDMPSLTLAASIVACDLADAGFTIKPVKTEYPYDTPLGREVTIPFYFQKPVSVSLAYAEKLLGMAFTEKEALTCLGKAGCAAKAEGGSLTVTPPVYRNDFLHPVDIVEELMIGKGMQAFEPVMPRDFTVGRLSRAEVFIRQVKSIMVGLGFQEMIYNYLGSGRDFIEKMGLKGADIVRIGNPMSESFEYVRNSILPCLLSSESVSGNGVYPHRIFEVGKIALLDPSENYGTATKNYIGFLAADKLAGFNEVNANVSAFFYYINREYTLSEIEDPRFIGGRCAAVMADGRRVGLFGELRPEVLDSWGISMPCSAGEVDLDFLREE